MKNVYDQVRIFYENDKDWSSVVKREWIEGFLRQQAWQGSNDKELQNYWHNIEIFLVYLAYAGISDLEDITKGDYSHSIEWLSDHLPDFHKNLTDIRNFFNILIEFYKYLLAKRAINDLGPIESAAHLIAGGDRINLIAEENLDDVVSLFSNESDGIFHQVSGATPEDFSKKITETVERLMVKLGNYFHQENFNDDFDRALYLYTGPFEGVPHDDQDEFWLGFWDYFLFDYHLLSNDATPMAHFYHNSGERLTSDEREILKNLLNAKFTVFYISKVLNQDWVECTNLFTNETFQLPFPDFDYRSLKKLLFFGHIFAQGMVMINYVTSIEVSPNLRKRIRDEVIRQKEIYSFQKVNATLDDFFSRHAQAVRHSIDVLVTLAKVNVTSPECLIQNFPEINEVRIADKEVLKLIDQVAIDYRFSAYDISLMKKIWHDYCQLADVKIRKAGTWAAALLYAYSQINNISQVVVEELACDLGVSSSSVRTNRNKLFEVLKLCKFDPRYLSEEGFMFLIFVPR